MRTKSQIHHSKEFTILGYLRDMRQREVETVEVPANASGSQPGAARFAISKQNPNHKSINKTHEPIY